MISINNVQPLSPETLFDVLKKELAAYINEQLDANLTIEFAHVFDVINITFPEITEGNAYTLTVSEDEIQVIDHTSEVDYNMELIEQHLIEFLNTKAS
ncbi:MAG: hypothetical protein WKF66_12510 [Pedobacter sp.]